MTTTVSDEPIGPQNLLVIYRNPSRKTMLELVDWCDVFWQNNISIRFARPLFRKRKPWLVTTATWLNHTTGKTTIASTFKRWLLGLAHNIYISEAVAKHVGWPGTRIPNPYDADTFRILPEVQRDKELVFLGRLVSDKGCDLILEALSHLKSNVEMPNLTIIGSGPDQATLEAMSSRLGLENQVRFAGVLRGEQLAVELNRHKVLVVPSRWNEPFGVVALEGIACGCGVVGSEGGGLPDAIGSCGILFPNGNALELSKAIQRILSEPGLLEQIQNRSNVHLVKHQPSHIANEYLRLFESTLVKTVPLKREAPDELVSSEPEIRS